MVAMEAELQSSENELKNGAKLLCEECNSKEFKYKCPACFRRTCSLPCVNSHKQLSGCTGKKSLSQIIPLSQFDDSTLLSDYNLLEDVKRVAESAQRMRVKLCGYHPQFRLPFHLKALRTAVARKGTKLLLLPAGMAKREKNQTRYNQRKKSISWTIEWRFNSTDVALLEHGVHESTTLRSVIEKHLQPSPWKNKLRRFCEEPLDNLKLFIRKYHKGNKAPYRELDLDTPLNQLFGGLVILEYPIIRVFLPSDSYDFEVVKDVRPPPSWRDSKRPDKDDIASPVGVTFREEEIKEDETALEPQIIDLLKRSEADTHKTNLIDVQKINEQSNDSPNKSQRHKIESDIVFPGDVKEVEMLDAKNEDFDFDQELIDAYSFLMEENNPDDYLNYKPDGEAGDHVDTNVYFADVEELEEGEIPNSEV
ncbi:box C/D snoRNA protein 1-like [Chenopodium quinoa]|uniref:box C/D snoRNA protein 1-like n=1 Tax=Chenopodium quinoa TaxID=63459 RepID=UPI000B776588|nr:box C/D snoRNA protein 1-like [Chenopodium quinoa]